jgi:hypothetical protein
MAKSPAHKFGQIIGDILEEAMIDFLQPIAKRYSLYLDYPHPRMARKNQKEVRWEDINGNTHKLDIVMEENGSELIIGNPRVFIEMAWRKYTKHSKNKAQEISGAISPLIAKYSEHTPFFAAIVAGDFTKNSLDQMKSEGFEIVYMPIGTIEKAFSIVGIDAHWEETTSDKSLGDRVEKLAKLTQAKLSQIKNELIVQNKEQLDSFVIKLSKSLERKIASVRVVSIFGKPSYFQTIDEACLYISSCNDIPSDLKFYKFEIFVRYSNGDKLDAEYKDRQTAIAFLRRLA